MTKPFDPTKPVQTRDGRKARILATDFKSSDNRQIVVAITDSTRLSEYVAFRYPDGRLLGDETWGSDLVNVPEERREYRRVWNAPVLGIAMAYSSTETEEAAREFLVERRNYLGLIEFVYVDDVLTATNFIPW